MMRIICDDFHILFDFLHQIEIQYTLVEKWYGVALCWLLYAEHACVCVCICLLNMYRMIFQIYCARSVTFSSLLWWWNSLFSRSRATHFFLWILQQSTRLHLIYTYRVYVYMSCEIISKEAILKHRTSQRATCNKKTDTYTHLQNEMRWNK